MPKGSGICVPFGVLFSTSEQLCSCQTPWESRTLRTGEPLDSLFNCLKAIFQECISLSLHRLQVKFRLYSSPWLQHQNHNGLESVLNGRVLNSSAFRFPRTVGDTGIPSNPRELSNPSFLQPLFCGGRKLPHWPYQKSKWSNYSQFIPKLET